MKKIVFFVNDINFFKNHFFKISLDTLKSYKICIISDTIDHDIKLNYPEIDQFSTPILRSSVNPFRDIRLFINFYFLIKNIKPDIIHNITIKPILYGSLYSRLFNKKIKIVNSVTGLGYAITNNKIILKYLIKLLIKLFVPASSYFLFLNKHDKKFYNNLGKVSHTNNIIVNGSGVDKKEFQYKNPIRKDKIEIIFTGRILKDKGVINLIEAVNQLDSRLKSKIILKLYGSIDDQNPAHIKQNELEKILKPGFIEWFGFSTEIIKILEKSDIYCLPSFREGIPKSIIEAMAIGRPIITTIAPGCEDTVVEGENGFKVEINNSSHLSSKLEELILDADLRLKMGKRSREIFVKKFSLDIVSNQINEVYHRLIVNN